METRNDSHCGLYCGSCLLILALKRGKLKVYARQWKCAPEDLECYGCRSEKVSKFCSECTIRDCARGRGVGFCIDCGDYPCAHFKRLKELSKERPHLRLQPSELERVRTIGSEQWLEYQRKRWSCKKCGTSFSWYDEVCTKCGSKLYNAKDEAADLDLL